MVAADEHSPVEQVEGYRDLSVIGSGATSRVYRAYQERVRRWVALKVLLTDGQGDAVRQRFDRERSLLAELGAHPHIVQVLDAGRTAAGRPYVAMDLCDGSLADRVERDGPLAWPEAVDLMVKVAAATQAAHDLGVLHRDIKPQNILVSKYGPLLADFGIARAKVGLGAGSTTLQMSPLYAAPEVFFGAAPATEASDVYSLGATLYALLTGQTPFGGVSDDHVYEYLTRIQVEHPAAIGRTDLPGRVVEVVARSISADPTERHPTAGCFADELRTCLLGRQLVATRAAAAGDARPSGSEAALALTELFGSGTTTTPAPPTPRAPSEADGPRVPVDTMPRLAPGVGRRSWSAGHRDGAAPRPTAATGRPWPPRPARSDEPWRPTLPPPWRRWALVGVVASCLLGLAAVAAPMVVGGSERAASTGRAGAPVPGAPTTAAPASTPAPTTAPAAPPTSAPASPSTTTPAGPTVLPPGSAVPPVGPAAGDPFPTLSGYGLRPPSDTGRYRTVEDGYRRALTAGLGVDVPEAQTREVVAGGNVVGFVFAHALPEAPPVVGDRWATVELPGSAAGPVSAAGPAGMRVAATGKNWVASWWAEPNGFVAVFGNEASLRAFLAEWGSAAGSSGG